MISVYIIVKKINDYTLVFHNKTITNQHFKTIANLKYKDTKTISELFPQMDI